VGGDDVHGGAVQDSIRSREAFVELEAATGSHDLPDIMSPAWSSSLEEYQGEPVEHDPPWHDISDQNYRTQAQAVASEVVRIIRAINQQKRQEAAGAPPAGADDYTRFTPQQVYYLKQRWEQLKFDFNGHHGSHRDTLASQFGRAFNHKVTTDRERNRVLMELARIDDQIKSRVSALDAAKNSKRNAETWKSQFWEHTVTRLSNLARSEVLVGRAPYDFENLQGTEESIQQAMEFAAAQLVRGSFVRRYVDTTTIDAERRHQIKVVVDSTSAVVTAADPLGQSPVLLDQSDRRLYVYVIQRLEISPMSDEPPPRGAGATRPQTAVSPQVFAVRLGAAGRPELHDIETNEIGSLARHNLQPHAEDVMFRLNSTASINETFDRNYELILRTFHQRAKELDAKIKESALDVANAEADLAELRIESVGMQARLDSLEARLATADMAFEGAEDDYIEAYSTVHAVANRIETMPLVAEPDPIATADTLAKRTYYDLREQHKKVRTEKVIKVVPNAEGKIMTVSSQAQRYLTAVTRFRVLYVAERYDDLGKGVLEMNIAYELEHRSQRQVKIEPDTQTFVQVALGLEWRMVLREEASRRFPGPRPEGDGWRVPKLSELLELRADLTRFDELEEISVPRAFDWPDSLPYISDTKVSDERGRSFLLAYDFATNEERWVGAGEAVHVLWVRRRRAEGDVIG
jgi:hypothetical protein